LRSALGLARRELTVNARPTPAFLDAFSGSVVGLAGALSRCEAEVALLPESDRLALVRRIGEARAEIAVVAKLAAGSARFASLVREVDPGEKRKGLYGPGGTASGGHTSGGLERAA